MKSGEQHSSSVNQVIAMNDFSFKYSMCGCSGSKPRGARLRDSPLAERLGRLTGHRRTLS